ncbi:MAG TPA: hypothetical protein VFC19_11420 [Candidatus Limnocylindrales bacterium]|nr:hypothetical protein [Candidatus Limnocylindrales bacterium]
MAQLGTDRWPTDGLVRELLEYLHELHRLAGQPSLRDIGKAVSLGKSSVSAFFSGARMISRGNLELVIEYLGGDVQHAEQLRRGAATAWNTTRLTPAATLTSSDVTERSSWSPRTPVRAAPGMQF